MTDESPNYDGQASRHAMTHTLLVIDDALPDRLFEFWSDHAHTCDYQPRQHTDGVTYQNIGLPPEGKSLRRHLERAIGQSIRLDYEFLRLGEPGDGAGGIHADSGESEFASVLYLNDPREIEAHPHGTAFWRSREFGADRLRPTMDEAVLVALQAHRDQPDEWEQTFLIPAVANRLIVYPSNVFHSRWPYDPAAGRLVHVAFFTIVGVGV